MTKPQPDWKTASKVTENVFMADAKLSGVGHPDFSGGCGIDRSYWKADYVEQEKKKAQERTRKDRNYLQSVEERLKSIHFRHDENNVEFARLMENTNHSWKSQEMTIIGK